MSRSELLRVCDVKAAYRVIGDCLDVGGDPIQWQGVAFEGMCRLVGALGASGGEGMWSRPSKPLRPITTFMVGFDDTVRERLNAYMRVQGVLADPIFQRLQHVPGRIVTRTRRELVPNREWYRSLSFNEYRKGAGFDHQLTSIYQVSPQGAIATVCACRGLGERDFSGRERDLASFFHAELGRFIGRALVSATEPTVTALPPRLRQTLACLLEGDSEKQIAARLGLGYSTVHQYVTMLYRRFGVQSRAELMAYVFKRRAWLPVLFPTSA
jgi:DNA-binding CsgD family transcriptional regulator